MNKQTTISNKLKPSPNKSPKSLNNSFSYIKKPPIQVRTKHPQPKTIETPRFKLKFTFSQHSETQQSQGNDYFADVSKEYFSFGENNTKVIQTEPSISSPITNETKLTNKTTKKFNSPINSKLHPTPQKKHTKGVRSTTESLLNKEFKPLNTSTEKTSNDKTKNNYFNAYPRSTQKSLSFHMDQKLKTSSSNVIKQKVYPDTIKKQPDRLKTDVPSKHIQIFNNNYNIININDTSTKEKRDSLKSLQKQFQQILQTQQLLENKSTYKKPVQSEKSIASIKGTHKKLSTSQDNIFQPPKS